MLDCLYPEHTSPCLAYGIGMVRQHVSFGKHKSTNQVPRKSGELHSHRCEVLPNGRNSYICIYIMPLNTTQSQIKYTSVSDTVWRLRKSHAELLLSQHKRGIDNGVILSLN